jgi:hypothetical protein
VSTGCVPTCTASTGALATRRAARRMEAVARSKRTGDVSQRSQCTASRVWISSPVTVEKKRGLGVVGGEEDKVNSPGPPLDSFAAAATSASDSRMSSSTQGRHLHAHFSSINAADWSLTTTVATTFIPQCQPSLGRTHSMTMKASSPPRVLRRRPT